MANNPDQKFTKREWLESYIRYSNDNLRVAILPDLYSLNNVRYKLICNSIEFALKGLLYNFGHQFNDLKIKYGHDIYALASIICTEYFINKGKYLLTDSELKDIKKVSPLYENSLLNYPNEKYKGVPGFDNLVNIVKGLVGELELECKKLPSKMTKQ